MLNFISLEEGHNYLCINGTETGPLELKNLPGTKYNFFSPNNQYFYTSIGVCCLTATDGFHIVGIIEEDID